MNHKCILRATYLRELCREQNLGNKTLRCLPSAPMRFFCKEVLLEMHGSRICKYGLQNKCQFAFDLRIGIMSFYLVINEVKNN